ncbi:hypothetical protein [Clostridium sp. UBA4548]|nr:hypothetical protein [Clostridium sp. UBA4548]
MSKVNEIFPKVAVCFVFFLIAATIIYNADNMGNLARNTTNETLNIITHK